MKTMENELLLSKENEKNKTDKIVSEIELDNNKRIFAQHLLNGLGETINVTTINPKPIKYKKWFKIKRLFKKLFNKDELYKIE